jgi:hypothetical protein
MNEKVLTFAERLDFFYEQEYGKYRIEADSDMYLLQIWNSLKSRHVNEGRTLSPPPPLFIHFDLQTIKQVEIHKINF